jgi:hypothetical protein
MTGETPSATSQEPDDKFALLGDASSIRRPNEKHVNYARRLFSQFLVIVLALFAVLLWFAYLFYQRELEPILKAAREGGNGTRIPVARAVEVQVSEGLSQQLISTEAQIGEIQQQIAGLRATQQTLEEKLAAMGRSDGTGTVMGTADAAGVTTPDPATSALTPTNAPDSIVLAELRLLKERNRLTGFADEAISTGNRKPLDRIVATMKDSTLANLYHAAQAEYYRVMGHYQFVSRIDPSFKLPVAELFPASKVQTEAELKVSEIIGLMQNEENPWQVRLRSAFLLGSRRTPEVIEALVTTLKNDPSLDVAKEAQLSLEQNVGRRFLLFDAPAIEAWWAAQSATKKPPSR